MALKKYIRALHSDRNDVDRYQITIYDDNQGFGSYVYMYERRSIHYDGGAVSPSFSEIEKEAQKLVDSPAFNCGLVPNVNTYSYSLKKNRLDCTSLSLKNGEYLGAYLDSNSFHKDGSYTIQVHNYEYGFVVEKYATTHLCVYLDDGELRTGLCTGASNKVSEIDCHFCSLSHEITSLPDNRVETNCCILACCEPEKYKLV